MGFATYQVYGHRPTALCSRCDNRVTVADAPTPEAPFAYAEVVVERAIETVFAYLADGEAVTEWMPEEFSEVEKLSAGTVGAGTAYRYVLRTSRVESVWHWDEYEPFCRLVWSGAPVKSMIPFSRMTPRGRYDLEEAASGTLVRASIDPDFTGVLRLTRRLAASSAGATWTTQVARMKQIVESRGQ